jgi:hypothetical protein
MKIIKTVYLSPTNTRGSRIKATLHDDRRDDTPTITIGYPHELSGTAVFTAAVSALFVKHNITISDTFGDRTMLPIQNKRGYDFVITDSSDTVINIDEMKGFFKALGWPK